MNETSTAASMRLFIAVDPSPECIGVFGKTIERLRTLAPRARWVRAEKLHVTLVFLGQIEETRLPLVKDAVQATAENHGLFVLRFAEGGTFGGSKRARVLWAGIGGDIPELCALQSDLARRLEAAIGYTPEHRAYSPHLTLARAGDPRGDAHLAHCSDKLSGESFGETTIREVVLYRSETSAQGATYTALLRVPLRR